MDPITRNYSSVLKAPMVTSRKTPSRNKKILDLNLSEDRTIKSKRSKILKRREKHNRSYRGEVNASNDVIKLPVIRMSQSDMSYPSLREGKSMSASIPYKNRPRNSSPYSYVNESQNSIVTKSTGRLATRINFTYLLYSIFI